MLRAEDARASTAADMAALVDGTQSTNASVRAIAARALGRLERASEIPHRSSPCWPTRFRLCAARAADADCACAATHGGGAEARTGLRARLDVERDPSVRAMLAESIGRTGPFSPTELSETALALIPVLDDTGSLASVRGGVRAASSLVRLGGARATIPQPLTDRLIALTTFGLAPANAKRLTTPAMRDSARYIRMVAAATLFGRTPDGALVARVADDPSDLVRDKAATALATMADTASARVLTLRLLQDPAPLVRFRAIAAYSRRFRANDCGPLGIAARDRDVTVSLAAIDALTQCRDQATEALLDSLAASLPAALADWHRAAHALVSLPATGDQTVRPHLAAFVAHANPFCTRTYAARVARKLSDTTALIALAHDRDPNVVAAAMDGLAAVEGHRGDSVYIDALRTNDSQQLMSAATALKGSQDPRAAPALLTALEELTRLQRETSRDGRVALLQRILELGGASSADRLRPFLTDFDSVVATRAAEAISTWTGVKTTATPRHLPSAPVPTMSELGQLARARVTIEMADGGVVELRLFPFDAPTNAERFARLARSGYFDGLTFHRVVAAFVVQGGSKHANEYFGDAAFTRDELGLENARGTVGLSTRGHDTGDGQLYFNLIDNLSLDHMYTVFAEVVSGMDVVDRMQEGAVIRRVTVR